MPHDCSFGYFLSGHTPILAQEVDCSFENEEPPKKSGSGNQTTGPALQSGEVQRILATGLLIVMCLLSLAPAFDSGARGVKPLPPCCRAQGQHKCAMRAMQAHLSTSAGQPALYGVCHQYSAPTALGAAVTTLLIFPPASQLFLDSAAAHLVAKAQSTTRLRFSFERSRRKRGPPSFLS